MSCLIASPDFDSDFVIVVDLLLPTYTCNLPCHPTSDLGRGSRKSREMRLMWPIWQRSGRFLHPSSVSREIRGRYCQITAKPSICQTSGRSCRIRRRYRPFLPGLTMRIDGQILADSVDICQINRLKGSLRPQPQLLVTIIPPMTATHSNTQPPPPTSTSQSNSQPPSAVASKEYHIHGTPPYRTWGPKCYGVARGRRPGCYGSLADALDQIASFSNPAHQGFDTFEKAKAFVYGRNFQGAVVFVPGPSTTDEDLDILEVLAQPPSNVNTNDFAGSATTPGTTDANADTAAAADVPEAAASRPTTSASSTSVNNVTDAFTTFSIGSTARRSLQVPRGLNVNVYSQLSATVTHGLDKQRFDSKAVKVISAAFYASANLIEFKEYCVEAGLSELEAAEIWCDIKTYPA